MTPAIISRSPGSKTPACSASATMVRISSSVTRWSLSAFWPSMIRMSLPDLSSTQTTGAATLAISHISGATMLAMRSGFFSASCLGTSSPMISDM